MRIETSSTAVTGLLGFFLPPPTMNRLVTWSMSSAGTSLRGGAGRRTRGAGATNPFGLVTGAGRTGSSVSATGDRSLSDLCRRTGIGFRFWEPPNVHGRIGSLRDLRIKKAGGLLALRLD